MFCVSDSVTSPYNLPVLIGAALLAACAARVEKPAEPLPAPEPPPAAAPLPEPEPEPEQPDDGKADLRITIASVGDMMIGTDFPENHLPDDDGAGFFASVTPVLAAADLTFGNLEGVLVDGGEPAKKCKNPRACYLFR